MKSLTQTHCNALNKIGGKLRLRQKMNHTQLIVSASNLKLMDEAEELINKAIQILKQVK